MKRQSTNSGIAKIKWWKDWDKNDWNGRKGWSTKSGDPQGLLLHHNGGAATESTKPEDNSDCSKDDNGAKFVNRHPDFDSLPLNSFLRRCGKLDVNAYTQCYHAGKGDFTGTDWADHKIPKDSGNGYLLGIEIASKGKKNDFTEAQWQTLTKLAMTLKELYGWKDLSTYYFPRHKDWAGSRKNDIQASNKFVQGKFEEYGQLWDGKVPPYDSVLAAQADQTLANKAVFRLTNRLHDIGFGKVPLLFTNKRGLTRIMDCGVMLMALMPAQFTLSRFIHKFSTLHLCVSAVVRSCLHSVYVADQRGVL